MKRTGIAFTLALLCAGLFSEEAPRGFYGMVQVGAGLIATTDNQEAPLTGIFNDDPRLPEIENLDRQDELVALSVPYLNGVVGYRFEKLDIAVETAPSTFMGSPGISLVKSIPGAGSFRGSVTWSKSDVWKNPYLTGTDRDTTDSTAWGLGAGWEMIMGLPLNLAYSIALIDIDEDEAGAAESLLDRDGADHTLTLSGILPLSEHFMLFPEFRWQLRDRDGDAESADGFGGSMTAMLIFDHFSTMSAVSYQHAEFAADHPVWNEERRDHTLSCTQMITLPELTGNEKLSLFVMGVYEERFSSVDFFEYRSFIVGSGVEYRF